MQMTYAEIAIHIGCSAENVRKIEHRAIRKLKENPECMLMFAELLESPDFVGIWELISNDMVASSSGRVKPKRAAG